MLQIEHIMFFSSSYDIPLKKYTLEALSLSLSLSLRLSLSLIRLFV